jgi:hypothetical protein
VHNDPIFILTSNLDTQLQDDLIAIVCVIRFDKPNLFRGFFHHENRTC